MTEVPTFSPQTAVGIRKDLTTVPNPEVPIDTLLRLEAFGTAVVIDRSLILAYRTPKSGSNPNFVDYLVITRDHNDYVNFNDKRESRSRTFPQLEGQFNSLPAFLYRDRESI
ncbi:MAG: hypothetical protein AAB801_00295, partial [Patescibacteria group bacterium]